MFLFTGLPLMGLRPLLKTAAKLMKKWKLANFKIAKNLSINSF